VLHRTRSPPGARWEGVGGLYARAPVGATGYPTYATSSANRAQLLLHGEVVLRHAGSSTMCDRYKGPAVV